MNEDPGYAEWLEQQGMDEEAAARQAESDAAAANAEAANAQAITTQPNTEQPKVVISKYRKPGFPGEWYLTDFTMEQVEGRLATQSAELERVKGESEKTIWGLAHEVADLTAALTRKESELAAVREKAQALRDYIVESPVVGFDVPDEIWVPFDALLK